MKKITILFIQLFLPLIVMSQSITVSPAVANDGQTLDVTITGTNTHFFTQASTTVGFSFNPGANPNSINIINDTALVVNVTVPANTFTGNYNVSVDNGNGTLSSNFHVNGVPPKSIVSVSPSTTTHGQTLNVTITGKNTTYTSSSSPVHTYFSFYGGTPTIVVNSTTVTNDTVVVANITVSPFAYTQDFSVEVIENAGSYNSAQAVYKANGFHVDGIGLPSLVSVSPTAHSGQTLDVIIAGHNTHFSQAGGMTVTYCIDAPCYGYANSINIINDTSVQVNITVPPQTYTGNYSIAIQNSIDGSMILNNSFHVSGISVPSPSLNPVCAKPGETLNVTITGADAHFSQGTTTIALNVQGVNSTNIINDSTIIVSISIPLNTSAGSYDLAIYEYNSYFHYLSTGFYIYDNCFSHYSTAYNSTDGKFTLSLDSVTTALGARFYWDFGDGTTSSNQTPTHVFAVDSIYNVCLKVITTTGDSCNYCHDIGKNNFGEIYRTTGFSLEVLNFDGTTDIDQIGKEKITSITVYPNPATDLIVVTANQLEALRNPILSMYSAEGQLLLQQPVKQRKTELNISSFAKGVYLIKISGEGQTQVVKFVKE